MKIITGSHRVLAFAITYLLICAAGTIGAYFTQGPESASITFGFAALCFLPMIRWTQEFESKRVERERSQSTSCPGQSQNK